MPWKWLTYCWHALWKRIFRVGSLVKEDPDLNPDPKLGQKRDPNPEKIVSGPKHCNQGRSEQEKERIIYAFWDNGLSYGRIILSLLLLTSFVELRRILILPDIRSRQDTGYPAGFST
jgi:hypothetical protein